MNHSNNSRSIELLAPAGNWECAHAAVENGADAIYFGLESGFNARARAANFHIAELPQLMNMLHRQAVRGYVTLNTLVFTDELSSLEENVRRLADAGVDAVLVQDLGVARLVREICPELQVHGSTQMTLTNATSIELAQTLGLQRVVLARELSLTEIRKIAAATSMPLEVFVHGALCVAYSGQCLTSESFGGRSANRGQCAQACRLPYELYCDNQPQDLGPVKYLLSPQDLAAYELVPQLMDAGVCSLKIEGRLKTPEYVANVCQQYRQAIQCALADRPHLVSEQAQRDLEMSFSRGFSPGWLEGCDHKRLVPGLSSAKRGVLLGKVLGAQGDALQVELITPLSTGDGIVLQGDRYEGKEFGGRVYELHQNGQAHDSVAGGVCNIGLQRGSLGKHFRHDELSSLRGLALWKTDDPRLTKRLRKTFETADPVKRVDVDLEFDVQVGQPIQLVARTDDCSLRLQSEFEPETARKHPLQLETLHQQLSRLGGSVYRLRDLKANIAGQPMVPLSELGKLRKRLIAELDNARQTRPLACSAPQATERLLARVSSTKTVDETNAAPGEGPHLRVLCRSLSQLEQVIAEGIREVVADFHDIRQYRDAIRIAHAAGARIEVATLRIHKPGEDGLFRALAKTEADGWLVRNLAAVLYCQQQQIPFACDFSLNVTNPLSAEQLIRWQARRITASYDLNRDQLLELVQVMPAAWLEVVIHQHMPMFHMEHCVFCSVLSPGKNKSDCGRPCDRHDVQLKDRVGSMHVLHADIGCRNTLYNGTAQSGAEAVSSLLELGVRHFRIELLRDTSAEQTKQLLKLYRGLLAGSLSGADVWQSLKADNRVGVTRGTLEQPRNPLAIL